MYSDQNTVTEQFNQSLYVKKCISDSPIEDNAIVHYFTYQIVSHIRA